MYVLSFSENQLRRGRTRGGRQERVMRVDISKMYYMHVSNFHQKQCTCVWCTHVCTHILGMAACMQQPQEDTGCPALPLSILFLQNSLLLNLERGWGQEALAILSLPQWCWCYTHGTAMPSFLHQVLTLAQQVLLIHQLISPAQHRSFCLYLGKIKGWHFKANLCN